MTGKSMCDKLICSYDVCLSRTKFLSVLTVSVCFACIVLVCNIYSLFTYDTVRPVINKHKHTLSDVRRRLVVGPPVLLLMLSSNDILSSAADADLCRFLASVSRRRRQNSVTVRRGREDENRHPAQRWRTLTSIMLSDCATSPAHLLSSALSGPEAL